MYENKYVFYTRGFFYISVEIVLNYYFMYLSLYSVIWRTLVLY